MFLFKKKNMYVDENGAYNPPGQHMIILNDSLNIMEKTVNPSTYFPRYELALKKASYCINEKQAVWKGMNCKQIYKMLSEDKSREMLHRKFIDRLFEANKENRMIFQMDEVGKYMSESTKIYFSKRFNG